jgi:hypothetical protein
VVSDGGYVKANSSLVTSTGFTVTGLANGPAGSACRRCVPGNLPQWDPGATLMTKVDGTHWTITLTGNEGVQLQYKYTLGSSNYVEKGTVCDEIARAADVELRNEWQPDRKRHGSQLAQRYALRSVMFLSSTSRRLSGWPVYFSSSAIH